MVGWVGCLTFIASDQASVDERKLATAQNGTRATKVSVMHAQYPNARHSGFVLHADLSALGAGDRAA